MKFGAGDLINNKWRLVRFIDESSSGIVFLAKDELQDSREGIIKIYKTKKETFGRESVLLTRVKGIKHVAEILGSGYTDDSREYPYIAEQYVEGLTLDRWAEERSLKERLDSLVQIAEGLKGIHERGVTHNDIKPPNVLVDEDDFAWLIDFGVSLSDSLIWSEQRGTRTYAPAEKFENPEYTDKRVDTYSFGAVAYEILTEKPCLDVDKRDMDELIRRVKFKVPVRPRKINPEISEDVEGIIMKCLEKKPEDRFGDGSELFKQIDGAVNRRIPYVVRKHREVRAEDDEGMGNLKRELLVSLYRNKIAPLVEKGRIPVGQFPYGIQKGRNEWFLTDAKYWTAGFWPGILWMGYEVTGEERFKGWAETWTKALDIEFEDRFKLNILGANAYYGYVPAFEITREERYLKKIFEVVEEIKKGFNEEVGFIQTDIENKNWSYTFAMESCIPLLAWSYKRFSDERLIQIIRSHAEKSIEFLVRGDGSVREIVEVDESGLVKEMNPSGFGHRTKELARMLYGLSFMGGFDDVERRIWNYFWDNLPENKIPVSDSNDPNIPNAQMDAPSSALVSLSGVGSQQENDKLLYSLIFNCMSRDEDYPGALLHGCGSINQYTDSSLIWGDWCFLKKLKEK